MIRVAMGDKNIRDSFPYRLWDECGKPEPVKKESARIDGYFFLPDSITKALYP